ncbi:MAG: hypothetical protein ACTSX1_08920, partial [Candidatus Heimdallarchaeaceae archaeon]
MSLQKTSFTSVIVIVLLISPRFAFSQISADDLRVEFNEVFEAVHNAELERGDISGLVDDLNQVLGWINEGALTLAKNKLNQVKTEALSVEVSGRDNYNFQVMQSGAVLAVTGI